MKVDITRQGEKLVTRVFQAGRGIGEGKRSCELVLSISMTSNQGAQKICRWTFSPSSATHCFQIITRDDQQLPLGQDKIESC